MVDETSAALKEKGEQLNEVLKQLGAAHTANEGLHSQVRWCANSSMSYADNTVSCLLGCLVLCYQLTTVARWLT